MAADPKRYAAWISRRRDTDRAIVRWIEDRPDATFEFYQPTPWRQLGVQLPCRHCFCHEMASPVSGFACRFRSTSIERTANRRAGQGRRRQPLVINDGSLGDADF